MDHQWLVLRSLTIFACWMSACELRETSSPAAIEIAPPPDWRLPDENVIAVEVGGSNSYCQTSGRDNSIAGSQHRGAQPTDAFPAVSFDNAAIACFERFFYSALGFYRSLEADISRIMPARPCSRQTRAIASRYFANEGRGCTREALIA